MRASKYCSHTDTAGQHCLNLVPGGTRNCPEHQSRWPTTNRTNTAAWKRARRDILAKHDTCAYCGAPATTVDHITAVAHGGTDDRTNLAPACKPCNDAKAKLEAQESRLA